MLLQIFITYYGAVQYLGKAVDSVLEQSDGDWHLTILDDCFPGNEAREIVDQLNDGRIRYVKNETNLGISNTFNRCVELSEADFLMIMGHDDALQPDFVAKAKSLCMEFGSADIIQPGVSVIGSDGSPRTPLADLFKRAISSKLPDDSKLSGDNLGRSLMIGNWAYFPSLLWRRETLQKYTFRPDFSICQDLQLISTIVLNSGSMVKNSEKIFQYRRHSKSLSAQAGQTGEIFEQERLLYSELAADFASKGMPASAFWARAHPFSRLSALLLSLKALVVFDFLGFTRGLRHAIS